MSEPSEEQIELSGVIEAPDMRRFYYFHMLRRTWWLVLAIAILMAMVLLLLVPAVLLIENPGTVLGPVGRLGLIVVLLIGLLMLGPSIAVRSMRKSSSVFGRPMKLAFTGRGVRTQGADYAGETSWTHAWRVVETQSQFLIYLNAGSAILVPKRFFADEAEMERWRALVREGIAPKRIESPRLLARWC